MACIHTLSAFVFGIRKNTERAREAEKYGDKGLAVQLEDMVRDESGRSEETERLLKD